MLTDPSSNHATPPYGQPMSGRLSKQGVVTTSEDNARTGTPAVALDPTLMTREKVRDWKSGDSLQWTEVSVVSIPTSGIAAGQGRYNKLLLRVKACMTLLSYEMSPIPCEPASIFYLI